MSRVFARCFLAFALFAAVAGGVDAGEPIEWSQDVKLTPEHFRQKIPAAAAAGAHSWVGLDVSWECAEGTARSRVRAVFDPERSWWRGGAPNIWGGVEEGLSRSQLANRRTAAQRDDDLLRHERLHFDLTELTARKIRKALDGLPGVCAGGMGREGIENSIGRIEREWTADQIRYDKE